MKFAAPFFAILLAAAPARPADPPPLVERALPEIKASVKIPEGWHVRQDSEDGVVVYQITRESTESDGGIFLVGFTLSVTPDVPGRLQMPPSQYAVDLLNFSVEEGGTVDSVDKPPFKVITTAYSVEGEGGDVTVTDVATANDKTGTLYFLAWQNPKAEEAAVAPLREAVLGSLKFDPAF